MRLILHKYIRKLLDILQNIYIKIRKSTIKNKLFDIMTFSVAYCFKKIFKKASGNRTPKQNRSRMRPLANSPGLNTVNYQVNPPHTSKKFRILLLLFLLLFSEVAMVLIKENALHQETLQTGIAENIIRFHVIANSDAKEDQELKMKVKEALVSHLTPLLSDTESILDAREILSGKLTEIQEIAEDTLRCYNCYDTVTVTLADCFFPLKVYGDYTFPPGTYEALRVQIGDAGGQNWWCVMFPPLCFVDETYAIIDESSKEQLKNLLTEEEYDTLISEKTPVKIKFKLWEELKKLFRENHL